MARVRGKDTTLEKAVRSLLHRLGFRFRLHRTDLPGTPDIVMPGRRTVLFVHGCFWHQHTHCPSAKRPAGNRVYWNRKLDRNMRRDSANKRALKKLDWKVIIVWECQTKNVATLRGRLRRLAGGK